MSPCLRSTRGPSRDIQKSSDVTSRSAISALKCPSSSSPDSSSFSWRDGSPAAGSPHEGLPNLGQIPTLNLPRVESHGKRSQLESGHKPGKIGTVDRAVHLLV